MCESYILLVIDESAGALPETLKLNLDFVFVIGVAVNILYYLLTVNNSF